jgi:membrane-bound lytic murein transglycosylase A
VEVKFVNPFQSNGIMRSHMVGKRLLGLAALILLSACARPPVPSPESAFREVAATEIFDDLGFNGLLEAIEAQRSVLERTSDKQMRFGPVVVTRGEYLQALNELSEVLRKTSSSEEKSAFLRSKFRFFEIYGGKRWGEILLTSYFEPVIGGSSVQTSRYSHPLYAKPSDLVTIDLKDFAERFKGENALKGRLHNGTVGPYYTREEIDGEGVLKGKQLELCWVDPIEAFFLHIQGSGTVRLEDGRELFITYADKNGRRYEAIGKFLKERIAPHKVTMQRVEAALREMPVSERDQLLFRNPSYVFFRSSPQRAITALGIPATPGRTIAADPKFAPKGALALLSFSKPTLEPNGASDPIGEVEVTRLVLDQDSGGAITGTDRVDLFWGRGEEAKRYAGIIQDQARIVYLVPR